MVTKLALLVAVQAQPDPAVTVAVPVPPAAANDVVPAVAVRVQAGVVGVVGLLVLPFEHAAASRHKRAMEEQQAKARIRIPYCYRPFGRFT